MQLISINLGQLRPDPHGGPGEMTGIYKEPVDGGVEITKLGLAGDVIVSVKHHGGPDQAIYVYGRPDYAWWENKLGRELAPGTFGDNLTISGLESADFNIGDMLHIEDAVTLQVTAPRIPCETFAARMGDPQWVKKFRHAERPGLYCRVLKEGRVQAGDPVNVEKWGEPTVSLLDMYRDYYQPDLREESQRRFLSVPIAIRDREDREEKLQEILAAKGS